jgi:geranylgeranyl reductase family protein
MTDAPYDVLIVGAGPAGSAAALAARRRGAKVLLLDRDAFPRDKACGDGIAPHALGVLAELGVAELTDGYPPVSSLHVVGPGGDQVKRRFNAPVHTIPRVVFDNRLLHAAVAAGATVRRHRVRRLTVHDEYVAVDGISARVVIGADGAASTVRRHLGAPANPPGHVALAIRGYAPESPEAPHQQQIVMAGRTWPAYAWSFPIGDGRRNVGYGELLRGKSISRTHLLDRLSMLLPDVGRSTITRLKAHHLPLSSRRPIAGRGRLLLAGDALSLINPFTGEGIFYAVVSGALAGTAAADGTAEAGQRYAAALRSRLGRHLRHTTTLARIATKPSIVDAGVRAARRRQASFDALVELGLGDGLITPLLLGSVAWDGRLGR